MKLTRLVAASTAIALLSLSACGGERAVGPATSPHGPETDPAWTAAAGAVVDAEWTVTGGLHYPLDWVSDDRFDAGFSMYVAAWPLQREHPGPVFQSGLPSTWMSAEVNDDPGAYSTIEGGLGWWTATRFPTSTPKFIMGGVSADFFEFGNGPATGGGTEGSVDWQEWRWDQPQGKYAVAQLSPYVLFPPDGLNLDRATEGSLFGYGYHPLPLIDERTIEGPFGQAETGDNSWTLFLSTADFQGPVAFFLPEFFVRPLVHTPELAGRFDESPFLDANPSAVNQPVDVETHDVPAAQGTDADGVVYARIPRTQFPANGGAYESIIVSRVRSYTSAALADDVEVWFDGGAAPTGRFEPASTLTRTFEHIDTADYFGWMIIPIGLGDGEPEHLIDFAAFAEIDLTDATTFRYRWDPDLVRQQDGNFVIPEFYRLEPDADARFGKIWRPISEEHVPVETGLRQYEFPDAGARGNTSAYLTPTDPDSVWRSPGPVAGPYEVSLGDGSIVTYSWYRFVDQPSIRHADFTAAELASMQSRVEAIHRAWSPDRTYLDAPTVGSLTSLDAGLLVEPPDGLEVGYVPIVTSQKLAPTRRTADIKEGISAGRVS